MTSRAVIDDFLAQRTLALVGVSRGGKKFGNFIRKELGPKGYRLLVVHPSLESLEGEACYACLGDLPEGVGGVIIVVPPAQTERVVQEAAQAGITRVWIQQGAESKEAIRLCQDRGLSVVHGECILMFAEPTAFLHRTHRFFRGLLGRLPK